VGFALDVPVLTYTIVLVGPTFERWNFGLMGGNPAEWRQLGSGLAVIRKSSKE